MKIAFILLQVFICFLLRAQRHEIDSITLAVENQKGEARINSLNQLSWYFKNIDLDSSMMYAKRALLLSQKQKNDNAIGNSYNSLATVYSASGLFDSALFYHKQALSFQRSENDSLGMAASLNNLGICYDELGNYQEALTVYFESLELYEKSSSDPFEVAKVLGNIGIVYKKQKEYDQVLSYYQQALAIYEKVGSEFGQTVTQGNIANVLLALGNYELAITYSSQALESYKKAGYSRYVPYMLCILGIANDSLGNVIVARSLFEEAIEKHKEHQNKYELAYTYAALAANYRKTGDLDRALATSMKGLSLAEQIDALEFRVKGHLEVARNYSALGMHQLAYKQMERHKILNDSLYEQTKTKRIFELETQYETQKKEQQIAIQEAEIAEQEAELQKRQILLIASGLLLLVIVALALSQRSRLRKKQELKLKEAKLQARESELNATISSQEIERARYARDLHDGFGQMISILNMNLGTLKRNASPDERQQVFNESEKVINDMYDELKGICFDLMPQTLVKGGLQSALEEFAQRINKSNQIAVESSFFGLEKRLLELQEISIYRITQEWVNNVLKYSNADKLTIQVTRDEHEITLLIEDNGAGFDQNLLKHSKGNGWKNLQTRTNLIKGEIELETTVGINGNTLIVNAPSALQDVSEAPENHSAVQVDALQH